MKRIWKFGLLDTTVSWVDVPVGSTPLHLDMQGRIPTLWMEVDPEAIKEKRELRCVWTGEDVPPNSQYLGTVQKDVMVLHYYMLNHDNTNNR